MSSRKSPRSRTGLGSVPGGDGLSAVGVQSAAGQARESVQRAIAEFRLHGALVDLSDHIAACRLAAYRQYVGTTVRWISPVLLRACQVDGIDLEAACWRLAPDGAWPTWLCGPMPRPPGAYFRRGRSGMDRTDRARLLRSGLMLRDARNAAGGLGLRVLGSCLEVGWRGSTGTFRTAAGLIKIALQQSIPETLAVALVGRQLDDAMLHPYLNDLGLIILDVRNRTAGGTVLTVGADPVPWRLPWDDSET